MKDSRQIEQVLEIHQKFSTVLLFGAPGSGKGTLGKALSALTNHLHLSTGDIFRNISSASPLGQYCQSYTQIGNLIPDESVIAIWHAYLKGLITTYRFFPEKQLILSDGLPRTINQVNLIEPYVDIRAILVLEIENEDELIRRLCKRAKEEKRKDDADEAILRHRFQIYHQETKAVLDKYPQELIIKVNALQKPLEVVRDTLVKMSHILSI